MKTDEFLNRINSLNRGKLLGISGVKRVAV